MYADHLRAHNVAVAPRTDLYRRARWIKSEQEVAWITATGNAQQRAINVIARADIRDGLLYHEGELLTGEKLVLIVEARLSTAMLRARLGSSMGRGHGLGLEIHEFPRVSDVDVTLEVGDVVTVEPGLYDPRFGGIRIEDLIVVTEGGCRNLTPLPKVFRLD